jgi:site-specific recombinase XerD
MEETTIEAEIDPQLDDHKVDFIDYYRGEWKESTEITRREFLRPHLKWLTERGLDVTDVDTREMTKYLNHLQDSGQSGHSVSSAYTTVDMFYSFLEERGEIYYRKKIFTLPRL